MKILKRKKYSILSVIVKYSFVFIFAIILVANIVFAADGVCGGAKGSCTTGTATAVTDAGSTWTWQCKGGKTVDCSASKPADVTINSGITNPIEVNTLQDFIKLFIKGVLLIGIPLLVLAIIYAGFLYVKAQGNPGELEVAHRTLLYTIIGAALLLGAFVIANAIVATVADIESTT